MKCDTCDQLFPDYSVKVWNGKRVCPNCYQTLTNLPVNTCVSRVIPGSIVPTLRVNPATYIDTFAEVSNAANTVIAEFLRLSKNAAESGKRQITVDEARKWGVDAVIKVKAQIAKHLAEDLNMPIAGSQAFTIAANFLAGVHSASLARMIPDLRVHVPLTDDERRVAQEIGYHAWKAFTANQRYPLTEEKLQALTIQPIALAEDRLDGVWCKSWLGGWRLPLKSACDGAQQMARDRAYDANFQAVSLVMNLAEKIPTSYSRYGACLGLDP